MKSSTSKLKLILFAPGTKQPSGVIIIAVYSIIKASVMNAQTEWTDIWPLHPTLCKWYPPKLCKIVTPIKLTLAYGASKSSAVIWRWNLPLLVYFPMHVPRLMRFFLEIFVAFLIIDSLYVYVCVCVRSVCVCVCAWGVCVCVCVRAWGVCVCVREECVCVCVYRAMLLTQIVNLKTTTDLPPYELLREARRIPSKQMN